MTLKIGLPGAYDVTKKEIIDGFAAKFPNIKVEVQDAPWGDFVTKIATQIAGGMTPDVWLQENAVILGYGKRGVAEDLSSYIKLIFRDAFQQFKMGPASAAAWALFVIILTITLFQRYFERRWVHYV
ncbi:extracellular solute-binding protein [Paenibacillus hodogayensis]|uniref:Extracellular solute-binding protein n=1 Tax=Paenibacillus hodogayensis TaxID=279208 RepID=A0ABV5VZB7_9BACL